MSGTMWCEDACDAPTIERLSPLVGRNQKNLAVMSLLIGADEQGPEGIVVAAVDPVGKLWCRGDLTGRGEQVGDLLLRGDHVVVEFGRQPHAARLCHLGDLGVQPDGRQNFRRTAPIGKAG